jgi:hypothetical protein
MSSLAAVLFAATAATAQVTPAEGYTPPDDTPSIKVGMTLYPTYTYQTNPKVTDSDGNTISKNTFDVARAYINITGNISHLVAFRITPDITRESGLLTLGPGSSVSSDSLVYRIKYAYAQFNLDGWTTHGSWARVGIQQTPWVDFDEGIYRYRFQGTVFAERIPLPTVMKSADAGASFHYNIPSNYGDVHLGVYNGENYDKTDPNNQKALEFRGTLRPFATNAPVLRGVRAHLVYYDDHYVKNAERKRVMGNVTFEHQFLNAEFDYLSARDQTSVNNPDVSSNGYSFWATPRKPLPNGASVEGLLRYDHFTPNTSTTTFAPTSTSPAPGVTVSNDQKQKRTIVGLSYWFPHQGSVTTAILVDYDAQSFDNITTKPTRVVSIHGLLSF